VELGAAVAELAAGEPGEGTVDRTEAEAVRALESLGLSRAQSRKAVAAATKDVGAGATTEVLVREALKRAG
jgi:Holliday junction resolvasome RuvABC DNA-binding subunit